MNEFKKPESLVYQGFAGFGVRHLFGFSSFLSVLHFLPAVFLELFYAIKNKKAPKPFDFGTFLGPSDWI